MSTQNNQWIRRVTLIVNDGTNGIDLSQFRIVFRVENANFESPNTAVIRVYNLSKETVNKVRNEYSQVVLYAGYTDQGQLKGNFGIIFQGTIKQFRIGKEDNKNTYLDVLAADGDLGYNYGVVNATLSKGQTARQQVDTIVKAMPGTTLGYMPENLQFDAQHIPNIRGSVLFGLGRAKLRNIANTLNATWSIQQGKVSVIPNESYLPGEAVEINTLTGMIGVPEQTDEGIKVRMLLNPRLRIGGLVKLNDTEIAQMMEQNPNSASPIPYNQWAGFYYNAPISKDGTYAAYVIEHEGDTRGTPWYSNLICLAVDVSTGQVTAP